MKKIIISFLVILFFFLSYGGVYAQRGQQGFSFAVKGGGNFSTLDIKKFSSQGILGYHAGVLASIRLANVGIQVEGLFSRQGSKFKEDAFDMKALYDYITLPLLLKFYPVGGFSLYAGAQFGFLINAKRDILNVLRTDFSSSNYKDKLKNSDIGLVVGVSWETFFGLIVDLRYILGFTEINQIKLTGAEKNQVIQTSLGYKIFKPTGHPRK